MFDFSGHKAIDESKEKLPPLSVLLHPTHHSRQTPENLTENRLDACQDSAKIHQSPNNSPLARGHYNIMRQEDLERQQHVQQLSDSSTPSFSTSNDDGVHSSRVLSDVRLPSINHVYPPQRSVNAPLHHERSLQLQQSRSETFSQNNLSPIWSRQQAPQQSPRQSSGSLHDSSPSAKPPVRFVNNIHSPEYIRSNSFAKNSSHSSALNSQNLEKVLADMQKITEHCSLISQFAAQYGDYRIQMNKFGQFPSTTWTANHGMSPEAQIPEMINKTYEILGVLNNIKSDLGQTTSSDQETINLIRTKRTTVGPSATRTKYRKRSKRAAPPGRCHSCNISETPEWRRGPDGARTLCNACGLHFAKLTRKRALTAMHQQSIQPPPKIHRGNSVLPNTPTMTQPPPLILPQPKPPMSLMGALQLAAPHNPLI
ncbi:9640_t:CDS:2 [Dentiscutata erythropus]|uniref:9640_t:CDS:1 n=1 Tax=Dentiscutata erythropus TaxID=1348616 RepID=A0A9N9H9I4_9GLOM|nr:9640_t:CDS:2 [Dentiscutata erythropus]